MTRASFQPITVIPWAFFQPDVTEQIEPCLRTKGITEACQQSMAKQSRKPKKNKKNKACLQQPCKTLEETQKNKKKQSFLQLWGWNPTL